MDWDNLLKEFISLWVVIDPIGTIPVFLAVTAGLTHAQQRVIAIKASLIATVILLFFMVGGQVLMEGLNIHLESFQIAGGLVLFLFALTMIFGDGKPEVSSAEIEGDMSHLAVFPLAIPSIASPGAMLAVVMLTDNHRYSTPEQFATASVMLMVMAISLVLLLLANPIQHFLGKSGASIVSRVMGLILASVAVDNVLFGIISYFHLQ